MNQIMLTGVVSFAAGVAVGYFKAKAWCRCRELPLTLVIVAGLLQTGCVTRRYAELRYLQGCVDQAEVCSELTRERFLMQNAVRDMELPPAVNLKVREFNGSDTQLGN